MCRLPPTQGSGSRHLIGAEPRRVRLRLPANPSDHQRIIKRNITEGAIILSTSTFNIGVLGAGQIAQAAHFPAVRKANTAQLYAICDAADDLRG